MSEYKVKILKNGQSPDQEIARIGISLNNPKLTGKKFEAFIEWLGTRYEHVIVQLADSLHRHNIAVWHNMPLDKAHNHALACGDEWMEKHHHMLQRLPSYNLVRWDERLNSIDLAPYMAQVSNIFNAETNDSGKLMRLYIDNYMLRQAFNSSAQQETAYNASRNYVLEESAVYMALFDSEPAAEIYPGSYLPLPDHPNKSFTSIDFIKRK